MLPATLLLLLTAFVSSKELSIKEPDLRDYDGTDSSKPIYLAIDGTIYDVSASPAFYGPGGSYHHLTGRDASRAWVSECWDSPDQLTWRMDGIEEMFVPRYLDEQLEKASAGQEMDLNLGDGFSSDMIATMAQKALERLGKVTDKEKAQRREEDEKEAKQKVQDSLAHWVKFFAKSPKYQVVGKVVFEEDATPAPPALCTKALEKRPIKGGRLDALMNLADMGKKADGSDMPDFVKANLAQNNVKFGKDQVKDEL